MLIDVDIIVSLAVRMLLKAVYCFKVGTRYTDLYTKQYIVGIEMKKIDWVRIKIRLWKLLNNRNFFHAQTSFTGCRSISFCRFVLQIFFFINLSIYTFTEAIDSNYFHNFVDVNRYVNSKNQKTLFRKRIK